MIVHCPSCSTRHEFPALKPTPGGTLTDCHACGHEWMAAKTGDAEGAREPEIARLVEAARQAQAAFLARRRQRRRRAAAWAGLALAATMPAGLLFAMPDRVVAAVPATVGVYEWLGREVNIYGLEIHGVDVKHLLVDGKKVVAVEGEVTNVSGDPRKIPWLRFGMRAREGAEVYHWVLDTESRPLRPGESTRFSTRLAAPPETAAKIEIRFARADEIGSNTAP